MSLWRDFLQQHTTPSAFIELHKRDDIADDSLLLTAWQKSAINILQTRDEINSSEEAKSFSAIKEARSIISDYLSQFGMMDSPYNFDDTLLIEASLEAISSDEKSFKKKALNILDIVNKAKNSNLKLDCLKAVTQVVPHKDLKLRERFFAEILKQLKNTYISHEQSLIKIAN